MGKSIGIDLGTTNSVVAFKDTSVKIVRNNDAEELTRSCVRISDQGEPVVGTKVYNNLARHIPNVVFSIKRLMGASISDEMVCKMKNDSKYYPFSITKLSGGTNDAVAVILQGKEYTPEHISAEILRQLKNYAIEKHGEVTHAVITVPAYFDEKQKTATRIAANLAGLKVQRLLSEPTAAAISYGVDNMKPGESKVVLVYDFGGGTFDLSILVIADGQYIEAATGGDRWLGGDDIDKKLKEYIYTEIESKHKIIDFEALISELPKREQIKLNDELRKQIEDAKKQLSVNQFAKIELYDYLENESGNEINIDIEISRDSFESMIRPFIEKTIKLIDELLEKGGYPIETIDNILLVGGSSCIPLVKKMVSDKYGKDKVLSSEKPMLAIAEGAAILAHALTEEFECPMCGNVLLAQDTICKKCGINVENITKVEDGTQKVEITHTTSHNYYIQTIDINGSVKLEKIIDNASILPLNKNKLFKTISENQKIVQIALYADAENGTFNRQTTGFYAIKENLPKNSELAFIFDMDVNQTLRLQVYPKGKKENLTEVILGRGDKDSKCFEKMSECIEYVLASDSISDSNKSEFMSTVQHLVEEIKSIEKLEPASQKWYEVEQKVELAKDKSQKEEDNNELSLIFANILIDVFSQYIDHTDTMSLKQLVHRFEQSTNELEKQEILIDLEEVTNNYTILINVFVLKIAADQSDDAANSNKLLNYYNLAMKSIQDNDISTTISILNQASDLLKLKKVIFGGGIRT